ncbi:SRPBCC family protein [Pseudonocardia sp. CA-107938]|uniref:SRPBCC family protein n=1 Tax=Pseudonocardia sp. CA-107938 TaxID=3240021 RepID=UPI003D93EC79
MTSVNPDFYRAASVLVDATTETLYDMVSDVSRMGEWSPVCTGCTWDPGAGPTVGSRFTGRNATPANSWQTRCRVIAADRGRRFAFTVEGIGVDWTYTFVPEAGATRLTESWHLLPEGVENYRNRFGDEADTQITIRRDLAVNGLQHTLQALKQAAEQVTSRH